MQASSPPPPQNPAHPEYVPPYAPAPLPFPPYGAYAAAGAWAQRYPTPVAPAKPIAALVLGVLAGGFVILSGLFLILIGLNSTVPFLVGLPLLLGTVGLGIGILIAGFSVLLYWRPEHHVGLGVAVLILSIVSIVDFGGFFLGLILGVIAGALAIGHPTHPTRHVAPYAMAVPARMCVRCGRAIDFHVRFCPYCGTDLGVGPVPR